MPATEVAEDGAEYLSAKECKRRIDKLRKEMLAAAADLEFERAARLRDELFDLEKKFLETPVA